jgi:hypothetical protein
MSALDGQMALSPAAHAASGRPSPPNSPGLGPVVAVHGRDQDAGTFAIRQPRVGSQIRWHVDLA